MSIDLTQRPPRSHRVRLGGYVMLPRILDKGRALNAGKIGVYCGVRNNWDLGHSERTMNAKKIAVVSLLVAVVALAACRREECCKPLKLGAGDVAAAELAR